LGAGGGRVGEGFFCFSSLVPNVLLSCWGSSSSQAVPRIRSQ
jgi:hypothetical protein